MPIRLAARDESTRCPDVDTFKQRDNLLEPALVPFTINTARRLQQLLLTRAGSHGPRARPGCTAVKFGRFPTHHSQSDLWFLHHAETTPLPDLTATMFSARIARPLEHDSRSN